MHHGLIELNSMTQQEFVRVIGPVFEHSPWIASEAAAKRPFANVDELHRQLCGVVRVSPVEKQLGLIKAHPDLAARGVLTAESTREQTSAGLDKLHSDENSAIQNQNRAYREKFGFPFVICARLNNKDSIARAFTRRLAHSREEEIQTALEEIFKIAALRLRDICHPD
jgi:2-oxo-4-hydroxy-4-carboxy-5-ureidoimidazoline decarboxylase